VTEQMRTRAEAAKYLRRPVATLNAWAYRRVGPPFYRVGRAVLYKQSDLDAWLEQQRVRK